VTDRVSFTVAEARAIEGSVTTVDRFDEANKRGAMGFLAGAEAEGVLRGLREMRDAARSAKAALEDAERLILSLRDQLTKADAELAEKTAALRQTDPKVTQRRLESAVAEARAAEVERCSNELMNLRAEVARQRSEITDLRLSKKKLREALERAKEGR